jgi:hypothetical protein
LQLGGETGVLGGLGDVEADANPDVTELRHAAKRHVAGHGLPPEGVLESLGGGLSGPDRNLVIVESLGFRYFAEQQAGGITRKRGCDLDGHAFGRCSVRAERPFPGGEHDRRIIVDLEAGGTGDAPDVIEDALGALIPAGGAALQDCYPSVEELGKALPKELYG